MKLSQILPLVVGGAVAGIMVSSASPAQALEFVSNGNFESNLTGWTTSGWFMASGSIGGNSSLKAVTNNTNSNPGNLSQTISGLVAGQDYNFSFDYYQQASTNAIIATLGSTTLASLINTTPAAFTNFSTTFTATAPSAVLNFQGYNDFGGGAFLDNVSLNDAATPVPFDVPGGATIPTVGSLFALGLMRQAKKRLAVKKLVLNPVETVAS
ncbi:carbohydrate binding domain-containing protein [Anabaena sp. UHCC 0451]|uniref:carbohydrate binding domain-containing protein n=1 Tax=Anabaena sp. UHCC 0451 TaxID=2055235 RepID=UPI002B20364C|nr:carbohydrate binding domain-containing protein [Anabaena sp. UHCC 0451]MEA5577390.1 carbohydrate binding domain-containing protein [Anabaena sp. UHCC 0451]